MRLKDLLLLIFFTFIFTVLIFIINNYFLWWKESLENKIIEEKYIEPVWTLYREEYASEELSLSSATKILYSYVPKSFKEESEVKNYLELYDYFLLSKYIENSFNKIEVMFYKEKWEVRGKMQNKKIKFFWLYNMSLKEFLSVGIHEFSHFFDLYVLQKVNSVDISDYFYDISWEDINIIKWWQQSSDFVSWYSMTNKYEDFAESFTYYVLHNKDFLEKTQKSIILKQKYDFFKKYIFTQNEFVYFDKKTGETMKDYYWDITKINYSLENFLQYLKN